VTINNNEIRDEFKQAQAQGGGQQLGGAADPADQDAAGGSSGTGGYGNAQNQSFHQGQTGGPDAQPEHPARRELSRGERFDLEQGGGRAADAVDFEAELQAGPADAGAVTEGQQP
jgi:hypothetical protein